jgi:hypothetical protein
VTPNLCRPGGAREPFFQRVEMEAFMVCINYRPRRVDYGALRDGSLLELANLVPWSGVELDLLPLHLTGCQVPPTPTSSPSNAQRNCKCATFSGIRPFCEMSFYIYASMRKWKACRPLWTFEYGYQINSLQFFAVTCLN